MNESLLITGTIAAVAVTAAVVSAPSIMNQNGTHPVPALPTVTSVFPSVPTTGPLAAIATPATETPLPVAVVAPVQPHQAVPVRPSASTSTPAIGAAVAPTTVIVAPTPVTAVPAVNPCLIGLVLDPLLGICVG